MSSETDSAGCVEASPRLPGLPLGSAFPPIAGSPAAPGPARVEPVEKTARQLAYIPHKRAREGVQWLRMRTGLLFVR